MKQSMKRKYTNKVSEQSCFPVTVSGFSLIKIVAALLGVGIPPTQNTF